MECDPLRYPRGAAVHAASSQEGIRSQSLSLPGFNFLHLSVSGQPGVLVTPFHNMMLVSPVTTDEEIDLLVKTWENCMATLADAAW